MHGFMVARGSSILHMRDERMRNTIPIRWTWLEQTAAPKRSTCTRLLQITARAGCERSVEGYFLVSLTVKGPAGICAAVPPSVSENQQLNEWHQTECATHCVSRILACQGPASGCARLFLRLGHSRRAATIWVRGHYLGARPVSGLAVSSWVPRGGVWLRRLVPLDELPANRC